MLLAFAGNARSQAPPLAELRKTAEQQPHSAPAQSNYGTGLKAAGRLDEAMERFDAALEIDPHYARAYNNMGNASQARGDYKTAVSAHGMAIKCTIERGWTPPFGTLIMYLKRGQPPVVHH